MDKETPILFVTVGGLSDYNNRELMQKIDETENKNTKTTSAIKIIKGTSVLIVKKSHVLFSYQIKELKILPCWQLIIQKPIK